MLVDPSGYIWSWAGAGIGAVIGAVVGTVGYLGFNAITGRPITWGGVAGAAAGGAVAGGIAGGFVGAATGDPSALVVIGGGVLIGAGSGAAGGLVSSIVSQGIDHGRIDWEVVAVDTAIGGAIGGVLGGVGGGIKVWLRPRPGVAPARHTWQGPRIQSGVGQTALRDRAVVNQIKSDMLNGRYRFEAPEGRIGGWRDAAGNYYIGEGHHRMAAALEIFEATGDASYVNRLLQYGLWTLGRPPASQIGPLPRR
jgi:hypothetical protein